MYSERVRLGIGYQAPRPQVPAGQAVRQCYGVTVLGTVDQKGPEGDQRGVLHLQLTNTGCPAETWSSDVEFEYSSCLSSVRCSWKDACDLAGKQALR